MPDFIRHFLSRYYSIKYPREWLEKVEYRRHNHSFYAYQSMVFDFDGYSKYKNEISITSTMFPYDFVMFDDIADDYIQTYEGQIVGLYYLSNTEDSIEIYFNISGYKNLHGNIKMKKNIYSANKQNIFDMLKTIKIITENEETEYYEYNSEEANVSFRLPVYWEKAIKHFRIDEDGVSFFIELGYPTESYPNYFTATTVEEISNDISEYNDLISYTYDGNEIRFKKITGSLYKEEYYFVIQDLKVVGRVELEKDIYENQRDEIIDVIKSFTAFEKSNLKPVPKSEVEADEMTKYTSKSHKLYMEYPAIWQEYVYSIGGDFFSIWFGSDDYFHKNYIEILTDENYISQIGEIDQSEWTEMISTSNKAIYIKLEESTFREKEVVEIKIMFQNSKTIYGRIFMDKDLYYGNEEEIMKLLKSIDINE